MMTAKDYMKIYLYNGVINEYAKLTGGSVRESFDTLYRSRLYPQIRSGVSDMHCRSEGYLADELFIEIYKRNPSQS